MNSTITSVDQASFNLSPGIIEELSLSKLGCPSLQRKVGNYLGGQVILYRNTIDIAEWLATAASPIFRVSNKGTSLAHVTTTNLDNISQAGALINTPRLHYFTNAFPDVFIHPLVELLVAKLDKLEYRSMGIGSVLPDGTVVAEHFNHAIETYQREALSPYIQKQLAIWNAMRSDGYATAKRFILSCEQAGYPRLLAIRTDLSLRDQHQKSCSAISFSQYLHSLWANHRHKPKIFKHCLGWIWSIEYTEECNYHAHCIFIFDGNKVQNDCYYADQIGQYWIKTITDNKGSYYNCNRDKRKYQQCGLGRIDLRNPQKRRFLLERVLPYLAKDDAQIASAIALDGAAMGIAKPNIRTFGCSAQLKPKLTR